MLTPEVPSQPVLIRLPQTEFAVLKDAAGQLRTTPSTLARVIIMEHLREAKDAGRLIFEVGRVEAVLNDG